MMTSQISRYVDFKKSQKPRYLENKTFSLQIKKFRKGYFMAKNSFVAEVTFRLCHFKVGSLNFSIKISNLAILLLNICKKLFFKKTNKPSHNLGGVPHVD